jgi:AAA15 family ATPase/GTPase
MSYSAWQVAAAILYYERGSLHYEELTEIVVGIGLSVLGGKTPSQTLNADLARLKDVFVKDTASCWRLSKDFDIENEKNFWIKQMLPQVIDYYYGRLRGRFYSSKGQKTTILDCFKISNFKAFCRQQSISIKPITLIYGANSSGKSSIIHSLLLAKHALDTGDIDVHRTDAGGDSVDLGGFRQYIHRRDPSGIMEWTVKIKTSSFKGKSTVLLKKDRILDLSLSIGFTLDMEGQPKRGSVPELKTYELSSEGKSILKMSSRFDGKLKFDQLDYEHSIMKEWICSIIEFSTTTQKLFNEDYKSIYDAIDEIIPVFTARMENFLPDGILKEDLFANASQEQIRPISRDKRSENLGSTIKLFLPRFLDEILNDVYECVKGEFDKLQYLGPLRSYPPRHLVFSQHNDPNWYAGGGYAWDVVRKNDKVRGLVNRWLGAEDRLQTKYELVLREFLDSDDVRNAFEEFCEDIAKKTLIHGDDALNQNTDKLISDFMKSSTRNILNDLFLVDKRTNTIVSHRDVGIGISQVLPVLVSAYASENKIIAIEQPEIHLHPALQAELADVFIESAMGERKNTFIIETHSEHLLLRVMRRIRETAKLHFNKDNIGEYAIFPEDVMVLFIEPTDNGSIIREMPLSRTGELVKAWPGGFFEEGLREIF